MRDGRYPPLAVRVCGSLACFTNPALKAERVSYPVMTPTAAVGVLESILWKPEMRWIIREIAVLNRIRYTHLLRNEVSSRMTVEGRGYLVADDTTHERVQRQTVALRDVAYVIRADVEARNGSDPVKYRDMFRRRVQTGQAFQAPYLGCREFAANFGPADGSETPLPLSQDLGRLPLAFRHVGDRIVPVFFPARLEAGVLAVPSPDGEGV
jgi:CRISPR-associated protein Cas5d